MAKDNNTGRNIVIGAAVAGIAGYVAGILTAPKSGKETRQDIKNAAVDAKNEAAVKLAALKSEVDELSRLAKEKAVGMSAKAKKELDDVVLKAKDSQAKAAEVLKAFKNGEATDPDLKKAVDQAKKSRDHLKSYLKK